ncbi:hypothetical protein [Bacillus sp. E(2018)]|uniref:DUF6843 domain-containing protein n=1 Tax=Bacillus sp. E(2018) TaxID=2502239 RepID=UPI0010F49535|nr:hypothetical protein [Bacillus sp. E(2018)]
MSGEELTNNIYLIPKGYEGSITVFYNIPNESKLKTEGKYSVIPVNELALEALAGTNMYIYAASFTSTHDMKYGTVNDQYFYVDKNGKRTTIDEQCIFVGGNGGFSGASGEEILYSNLQITQSNCSENFRHNGEDINFTQQKEVKNFWMSYFD